MVVRCSVGGVSDLLDRRRHGPPKTAAGRRTVGLPSFVANALEVHLPLYAEPGDEGLVFPAAEGGPMRRSNFRRRVWEPATAEAGVSGLRFHDLRHTAATLAAASGTSLKTLMAPVGHGARSDGASGRPAGP